MKVFHITIDLIAQDDFAPGHVDFSKLTGVVGAKLQGYSQSPYVGPATQQIAAAPASEGAQIGNIGG